MPGAESRVQHAGDAAPAAFDYCDFSAAYQGVTATEDLLPGTVKAQN